MIQKQGDHCICEITQDQKVNAKSYGLIQIQVIQLRQRPNSVAADDTEVESLSHPNSWLSGSRSISTNPHSYAGNADSPATHL